MTVKELIEALQQYPPDTYVLKTHWEYPDNSAEYESDMDIEWIRERDEDGKKVVLL